MNRVTLGLGAVSLAISLAFGVAHLTSSNAAAAAKAAYSAAPILAESLGASAVTEAQAPAIAEAPAAAAAPPLVEPPAQAPVTVAQPASPPPSSHTSATAVASPGSSASVGPLEHIVQTLNNCGPASVAEVLNHWGIDKTQGELAFLRHGDPIGMNSDYVASYVPTVGMREFVANQGSQYLIKAFVANGFPVIVSQYVNPADPVDHFRPIEAYDDAGQYFVADDPLMGDGYRLPYSQFDQIWGRYDRFLLVIFPPEKQAQINALLKLVNFTGPSWMTPSS